MLIALRVNFALVVERWSSKREIRLTTLSFKYTYFHCCVSCIFNKWFFAMIFEVRPPLLGVTSMAVCFRRTSKWVSNWHDNHSTNGDNERWSLRIVRPKSRTLLSRVDDGHSSAVVTCTGFVIGAHLLYIYFYKLFSFYQRNDFLPINEVLFSIFIDVWEVYVFSKITWNSPEALHIKLEEGSRPALAWEISQNFTTTSLGQDPPLNTTGRGTNEKISKFKFLYF